MTHFLSGLTIPGAQGPCRPTGWAPTLGSLVLQVSTALSHRSKALPELGRTKTRLHELPLQARDTPGLGRPEVTFMVTVENTSPEAQLRCHLSDNTTQSRDSALRDSPENLGLLCKSMTNTAVVILHLEAWSLSSSPLPEIIIVFQCIFS